MTQAAGLRGVAESFYTVFSTTTLSTLTDVCAIALLQYLVKLTMMCLYDSLSASAVIDLLKQLQEKDEMSTYMVIDQVISFIDLFGHQDS